ncbi:hypothetical protein MRB53_020719 [Persea americana]|uniref:Uncharacterized protein n=1 Tax=Persea americana TaxID=3435 RepID=A0ACC2L221_PERAE|nr:hypothetical protein MRB53_020719 [Persea americana]
MATSTQHQSSYQSFHKKSTSSPTHRSNTGPLTKLTVPSKPKLKATNPSINDLPYDVVSEILIKIPAPTLDTSNPFSILENCSLADPALNPNLFGINLQSFLEATSSTDLLLGF